MTASGASDNIGGAVLIIVIVFGSFIYALGYHRARMHRANKDYKTTKAAVPVLRKGFWSAWWAAVKVGFVLVLVFAALFLWMVRGGHDQTDVNEVKPSPSMSSHKR